jgi:hypothetical protein
VIELLPIIGGINGMLKKPNLDYKRLLELKAHQLEILKEILG